MNAPDRGTIADALKCDGACLPGSIEGLKEINKARYSDWSKRRTA